jgi:hypothetical protein
VEPLSLTVPGAAALTQGIGFLYGQAGDLLRRLTAQGNLANSLANLGLWDEARGLHWEDGTRPGACRSRWCGPGYGYWALSIRPR